MFHQHRGMTRITIFVFMNIVGYPLLVDTVSPENKANWLFFINIVDLSVSIFVFINIVAYQKIALCFHQHRGIDRLKTLASLSWKRNGNLPRNLPLQRLSIRTHNTFAPRAHDSEKHSHRPGIYREPVTQRYTKRLGLSSYN